MKKLETIFNSGAKGIFSTEISKTTVFCWRSMRGPDGLTESQEAAGNYKTGR